jgi:hypothetical protein
MESAARRSAESVGGRLYACTASASSAAESVEGLLSACMVTTSEAVASVRVRGREAEALLHNMQWFIKSWGNVKVGYFSMRKGGENVMFSK